MQPGNFQIKNFGPFEEAIIPLGQLTVLAGANGSGKSNLLRAYGSVLSYRPTVQIEPHFYTPADVGFHLAPAAYFRDPDKPIIFSYDCSCDSGDDWSFIYQFELSNNNVTLAKWECFISEMIPGVNGWVLEKKKEGLFTVTCKLESGEELKSDNYNPNSDLVWEKESDTNTLHMLLSHAPIEKAYYLPPLRNVTATGNPFSYPHPYESLEAKSMRDFHRHSYLGFTDDSLWKRILKMPLPPTDEKMENTTDVRRIEIAEAWSKHIFGHHCKIDLVPIREKHCEHYYTLNGKPLTEHGTGYSQALPLIVAGCFCDGLSCFIIEQPELHLHPDAQIRMAEFLIALSSKNQVLIETHSELIIKRIAREMILRGEGDHSIRVVFAKRQGGQSIFEEAITNLVEARITNWPDNFLGASQREAIEWIKLRNHTCKLLDQED